MIELATPSLPVECMGYTAIKHVNTPWDTSISYQLNCSVPQGSVLGPVEFVSYSYTEDIVFVRTTSHAVSPVC